MPTCYHNPLTYTKMFAKVLRRATHNGSVESWAFHDDTFTEATKDRLFLYQISHQDIRTITPKTLVFVGVCGKILPNLSQSYNLGFITRKRIRQ